MDCTVIQVRVKRQCCKNKQKSVDKFPVDVFLWSV